MATIRSRTQRDMVEASGRLCQLLGLPRSTGKIYGLLYLSAAPVSLDDIVEMLGISKASASNGTRQLVSWGAIRHVWVQGQRRDYYEVVADLRALIKSGFNDFLKPRLTSSQARLESLRDILEAEWKEGVFGREEYKMFSDRLKTLSVVHKRVKTLAPLAEKLL